MSDYSLKGVDLARGVCDRMGERNSVSWNVMMKVFIENNRTEEARDVFDEMPEKTSFSWKSMIMA